MNNNNQKLFLSFFILLFFNLGCQQGTSVENLSCNYQYIDKGRTNKMLISTDSIHPNIIPTVLKYEQNSASILILQKTNARWQSHLAFVSTKNGLALGNSKKINEDLGSAENKTEKAKFEKRFFI